MASNQVRAHLAFVIKTVTAQVGSQAWICSGRLSLEFRLQAVCLKAPHKCGTPNFEPCFANLSGGTYHNHLLSLMKDAVHVMRGR